MSEIVNRAVTELNARTNGSYGGRAKFVMQGEGTILLDQDGAREADGPADVTLTATPQVFREIFEGKLNPTTAYMSGRLKIDGSLPQALKLAQVL